jgi:Fic family protein
MVNESNDKVVELLTEILKWIKFSGAKEVRGTLQSTLDNEQKRLIYHLSDGNMGSVDIAKLSKMSDSTVRRYWGSWARRGIVESIKVRGGDRYKKSFELEDFDIQVPKLSSDTQISSIPSKEGES